MIENQEPFNFKSYAPNPKISTIIVTLDTLPEEPIEVECENDQYKIEYETELQLHLKEKSHYCMSLGKTYTF